MSKKETPLIRQYWKQRGGTLIEEFPAVRATKTNSNRWIDAIIIKQEEHRIAHHTEINLRGKDIIIVQAKASRLGMYLMGQVLFSKKLMESFDPNSMESIALCKKDDSVLRPLLEAYSNCKVVVLENSEDENAA